MRCQGILSVQSVVVEIPLRVPGHAYASGVLRLRSCLAKRSSYSTQDDRIGWKSGHLWPRRSSFGKSGLQPETGAKGRIR
jgi:hypothetical protein